MIAAFDRIKKPYLFHRDDKVIERLPAPYQGDIHMGAYLALDRILCLAGLLLGDILAVNQGKESGMMVA